MEEIQKENILKKIFQTSIPNLEKEIETTKRSHDCSIKKEEKLLQKIIPLLGSAVAGGLECQALKVIGRGETVRIPSTAA